MLHNYVDTFIVPPIDLALKLTKFKEFLYTKGLNESLYYFDVLNNVKIGQTSKEQKYWYLWLIGEFVSQIM